MKIAIIKYGMGNVASVKKIILKLGYECIITNNYGEIKASDLIILPGVGSFEAGMMNLNKLGLVDVLTNEVIDNKKPFIGICLGMQLTAKYGNEPYKVKGLGWIDGEVIRITPKQNLRIPHLGWNNVLINNDNAFYKEFENFDYYFIHSYHFKLSNTNHIVMTVNYDSELTAALQKDNIYAMQFHPEKSQEAGIKLLQKIIDQYA